MSLNDYVSKRCIVLEQENAELKKEVSLLKEMNDKMIRLIGKEMRRSFKITSEVNEGDVFNDDQEIINPSLHGFTESTHSTCHQDPQ